MEYAAIVLFYVLLAAAVFSFIFRAQLRVWWIRRKLKALSVPTGSFEPPVLTTRLYELDKVFGPFGSDAAHPSALRAQAQFIERPDCCRSRRFARRRPAICRRQ